LRSSEDVDSWRTEGIVRVGRTCWREEDLEMRSLEHVGGESLRRIAVESWRDIRGTVR
jgi:hypothetical protein